MWVPVWLYDADGRPMYYVMVQTPFASVVTYAGLSFAWQSGKHRYEKIMGPYYALPGGAIMPSPDVGGGGVVTPQGGARQEAVPEARAPETFQAPSSPVPTTVAGLRAYLLDGISRLLSHTWFVQGTDAVVLRALERLYLSDDEVVSRALAALKQIVDQTQMKEWMALNYKESRTVGKKIKKAIDWKAVLGKLEDLVAKMPAVASLVEQIVQVLLQPAPTPPVTYTAAPGCCPEDLACHLLEHLCCQQEDLAQALVSNLHMQIHLEQCCPDSGGH